MKNWKKSWTLWFNGFCGFVGLFIGALPPLLPDLKESLPGKGYAALLLGMAVVGILLRIRTNSKLVLGDSEKQ